MKLGDVCFKETCLVCGVKIDYVIDGVYDTYSSYYTPEGTMCDTGGDEPPCCFRTYHTVDCFDRHSCAQHKPEETK